MDGRVGVLIPARGGVFVARGLNRISIIGNLGRDPEVRMSPANTPVTTFSVAVNERRRPRAQGSLDRGVDGALRVVQHGHGEARGAPRHGPADTSQPHDAQRLTVHIRAQQY